MEEFQFEWDSAKAESNLNKHGVSFDEASTVFFDELARLIPDPDSSNLEERFIILGQSKFHKLLVVCHCYRDEEQKIRIISARKADKHERRSYEVFRHA
ncbi:BrnT family toxin [uncultured Paraglaciecola sp.]|uniref:BrnT family toxin n=1 Tax=uncultured Paraglaciecola sp. TaxID=1765024 RepID=UPI0025926C46|nr:BrnT family toxin [uncultured Paraglaciecola sp.]